MRFSDLSFSEREKLFSHALLAGEITVGFQPIIKSAQGGVTGFEALARWSRDQFGSISPGEFLPLVERCGLVDDFNRYVLLKACETASIWQAEFGNLRLGVNVSAAQFASKNFVPIVREVLRETGFHAFNLNLEFTEAAFSAEPDIMTARLRELEGLDVNLVVDDFGSNASAILMLEHERFDHVKIDRSFIRELACDEADQTMVRTIVEFCTSIGLKVAAVGVETSNQEELLRTLGCQEVQGFLHAGALRAEHVLPFLRQTNQFSSVRELCA